MDYVKVTDGVAEVYSIQRMKQDNPNVSFPSVLTDEILASYGVMPLTIIPIPDYDPLTHRVTQDAPVEINGAWVQAWSLEALPQADAETNIRRHRDILLSDTDWVVSKAVDQNAQDNLGIQIPQVWLDYRQALRDVPDQTGFPYNVVWPTKP